MSERTAPSAELAAQLEELLSEGVADGERLSEVGPWASPSSAAIRVIGSPAGARTPRHDGGTPVGTIGPSRTPPWATSSPQTRRPGNRRGRLRSAPHLKAAGLEWISPPRSVPPSLDGPPGWAPTSVARDVPVAPLYSASPDAVRSDSRTGCPGPARGATTWRTTAPRRRTSDSTDRPRVTPGLACPADRVAGATTHHSSAQSLTR